LTSQFTQSPEVYDLEYFSGSQMFLYIGDVWIDEITGLQYSIHHQKTPIFGYASQYWDDVSSGQSMVSGQMSINYKEAGYLWAVLRRFKNISTAASFDTSKESFSKQDKALGIDPLRGPVDRRPVWGSNGTRINRESIERVVNGGGTRGDRYKFYNDLAGYATFGVKNPRDRVFENIVEEFEDQIWAKSNTNQKLTKQIRNPVDPAFDGFDIFVVFGNYEEPKANHTVQKILDVRLTGQMKTIRVGGEAVQEVYDFIARTVV